MKQITLPYSQDHEMHVLGSMLSSYTSMLTACAKLFEEDFYLTENAKIFSCIKEFYQNDREVDCYTIANALKDKGLDTEAFSYSNLCSLAQMSLVSHTVEDSIDRVKDNSLMRQTIHAANGVIMDCGKTDKSIEDILSDAQSNLFLIGKKRGVRSSKTFEEIITGKKSESGKSFLQELEDLQETYRNASKSGYSCSGIPSGLLDLDRCLNGLNNSNLIILAARPAMGKSAVAMHIANHVCFNLGMPVGIFSLEMSSEQLVKRIVSWKSGVNSMHIARGEVSSDDYVHIATCLEDVQNAPMYFDDEPNLSIYSLKARARKWKDFYDIKLLIVDYLQLLSGSKSKSDNRVQEISEISRNLKIMAKELNIPVICLSQLSRKVEERTGNKPMLSDLRESGSIEQDADSVILLFREEYYDQNRRPGQLDLIVAKNRHGESKTVTCMFEKEIGVLKNYTPIEHEPTLTMKYYEE